MSDIRRRLIKVLNKNKEPAWHGGTMRRGQTACDQYQLTDEELASLGYRYVFLQAMDGFGGTANRWYLSKYPIYTEQVRYGVYPVAIPSATIILLNSEFLNSETVASAVQATGYVQVSDDGFYRVQSSAIANVYPMNYDLYNWAA